MSGPVPSMSKPQRSLRSQPSGICNGALASVTGRSQGPLSSMATMQESISDPRRRAGEANPTRDGRTFAARRVDTIDRLVRAGMPKAMADAWIDAWDASTADLPDFRKAPDYWAVGYRFAQEEWKRAAGNEGGSQA